MEERIFFYKENENILTKLKDLDFKNHPEIYDNISLITKKTSNNLVGYYQFVIDKIFYKIFIMPKIFDIEKKSDEENQKEFLNFFKKYYALKIKYKKSISPKEIKSNTLDLSFYGKNEIESCTNIDDFINMKYIDSLKTINNYFLKHKRIQYKEKEFHSQSISNRISLKKTIHTIDKSKVFQIKKEPILTSKIVIIALSILKKFEKLKLKILTKNNFVDLELLKKELNKNINLLEKKFFIDKSYRFHIHEILNNKVQKLFNTSNENRRLYDALLVLLGNEHFIGESKREKEKFKVSNMISLFFNPANLYEWIVYDELLEKYKILDEKESSETLVYFDKMDRTKIVEKYYLKNKKYKESKEKSSEPDFLIIRGNTKIIVDAKWKVVSSLSDIKFDDIVKLRRDCKLRNTKYGVLVYPKIKFKNKGNYVLTDDDEYFISIKNISP